MIASDPDALFDFLSLAPDLAVLLAFSNGKIMRANSFAASMFNQAESALEGSNVQDLLLMNFSDADAGDSFDDFVSAAVNGFIVPLQHEPNDHVSVRAVKLDRSSPAYAISLSRICPLVSIEPSVAQFNSSATQREALLSVAEEVSEFGCFSWDVKTDALDWSDGMLRIFGIERSCFTNNGVAFFNRVHPEDQPKISEAFEKAVGNNGHFHNTERILRPNGDIRWLESRGRLESDETGAPLRLVGVCRDITETLESANELKRQVDECKTLESQLLHAQKLEAIGKLTSGIAHDFNNLLTVINSGCELLNLLPAEAMRADARKLVDSIQDAGDRGSQLTEQLLLYGRSSSGEPQYVDLNTAVRDSKEFLQRIIGEDITICLDLSTDRPTLLVDPTQLQQILLNLSLNARDAMPGGGQLKVETDVVQRFADAASDSNADRISYAVLVISDSGTGVPSDIQLRIFDPYYTTKPTGSGTGLGLSVVWGIVHAAGGTVEVDSEVGIGTRFRIFLPQHTAQSAVVSDPSNEEIATGAQSILVVEDEVAVMDVIVCTLEQAGYRVTGIIDPLEAVRFAANPANTIHLLITDVNMPTMNGPDLAASINDVRPTSPLPVLFTSGNDQQSLEQSYGIRADENNFIQKPFRIAALARKVEETLASAAQ